MILFRSVMDCSAAFGCVAVASIAFGYPNALVRRASPLKPPCFMEGVTLFEKKNL